MKDQDSNVRLHFAHRHVLLRAQASQANHAAGTLQSNPALSSGHTGRGNQQVQLRTNSTETVGSSHEGTPPSQSRLRHATHRDSVISPTAQPRSSALPGEEAGPNGTLYTQKLVINNFISPEGSPSLTSLSSPAPQATPFFLFFF